MDFTTKNLMKSAAMLLGFFVFFFSAASHAVQDPERLYGDKAQCKTQTEEFAKKDLEEVFKHDEKKICGKSIRSMFNYKSGDRKADLQTKDGEYRDGACEGTLKSLKKVFDDMKAQFLTTCERVAEQIQDASCDKGSPACQEKMWRIIGVGLTERTAYVKDATKKIKELKAKNEAMIKAMQADAECLKSRDPKILSQQTTFPDCGIYEGEDMIGVRGLVSTNRPTSMQTYLMNLTGPANMIEEQKKVVEIAGKATGKLSSISEKTASQAFEIGGYIQKAKAAKDNGPTIDKNISTISQAGAAAKSFMDPGAGRGLAPGATLAAGIASAAISAGNSGPARTSSSSTIPNSSDTFKSGGKEINTTTNETTTPVAAESTPAPGNTYVVNQGAGFESGGISTGATTSLTPSGTAAGELNQDNKKEGSKTSASADTGGTKLENVAGGGGGNEFISGAGGGYREKEEDPIDSSGDIASVLSKMKSMFDMDEPMGGPGNNMMAPMGANEQALAVFDNGGAEYAANNPHSTEQSGREVASEKSLVDVSLFSRARLIHKKYYQKGLIRFDSRVRP